MVRVPPGPISATWLFALSATATRPVPFAATPLSWPKPEPTAEATLGVRFGSVEYSNRVSANVPLGLIVAMTAAEVGPTVPVTTLPTAGRGSVVNEPDG